MARWEELYREASDLVARVPTPHLDPETRKVWVLMGALSEALWRRAGEPGFSFVEAMVRNARAYRAESEDEVAIWGELTAPHNYPALARYIALCGGQEYAGGVLEAARRRWEVEQGQAAPPPAT
jgi:hypothetical protein